ncbi:MAG: hypothetical protein UI647_07040, partial [Negativibacillus sp.]
MKNITNKGTKIISIGTVLLLPGETKPLPVEYEKSEILDFFQERGVIEISEEVAEESAEQEAPAKPETESKTEPEDDKPK